MLDKWVCEYVVGSFNRNGELTSTTKSRFPDHRNVTAGTTCDVAALIVETGYTKFAGVFQMPRKMLLPAALCKTRWQNGYVNADTLFLDVERGDFARHLRSTTCIKGLKKSRALAKA